MLDLQGIVVDCKIVRCQLTQSPDTGPIHIITNKSDSLEQLISSMLSHVVIV